jgi:hypothetical protein
MALNDRQPFAMGATSQIESHLQQVGFADSLPLA